MTCRIVGLDGSLYFDEEGDRDSRNTVEDLWFLVEGLYTVSPLCHLPLWPTFDRSLHLTPSVCPKRDMERHFLSIYEGFLSVSLEKKGTVGTKYLHRSKYRSIWVYWLTEFTEFTDQLPTFIRDPYSSESSSSNTLPLRLPVFPWYRCRYVKYTRDGGMWRYGWVGTPSPVNITCLWIDIDVSK